MRMTEAFTSEFGEILDRKYAKPNEHFQDLVTCLKKHLMCYRSPKLHPSLFLTHLKNRGGLLLSPHNAHKNAANMYAAAADLEALSNAWAIELPSEGKLREIIIQKNQRLIEKAEGLLAQINHAERFSSVGCGHTVAWCKHADAGGSTPEKKLQMSDSDKIDLQKIFQDRNFKIMITEGWEWWIVYAEVDSAFPQFAVIAQQALNTRNHIANTVGELEVCMTLANSLKDAGLKDEADWKGLLTSNIESLCAPCAHYSGILLEYILKYGGGDDACLIQFIDSSAKQFRANIALGETFWRALVDTEFYDKTCKYPMVRTAMIISNLTGGKVEDGVARLLSKTDIQRAAGKPKAGESREIEQVLQDAWQIVQAASDVDACIKPLGQLFARLGLKLLGIEKKGRESKVYSLSECKHMFLNDVSKIVGKTIQFEKWEVPAKPNEQSAENTAQRDAPKAASLDDHSDPVFIMGSSGFKIGNMVVEKGVDVHAENIFTIFSIENKDVALHQVCSYSATPTKYNIELEELIKNWMVTKTEPPKAMSSPTAGVPEAFMISQQKYAIFSGLVDLFSKHANAYKHMTYYKGSSCIPDHVRTGKDDTKANSLTLIPLVPATNIVADSTSASKGYSAGTYDGHTYTIMPLAKPVIKDNDWAEKNAFVNPFFWVGKTVDRKVANMVEEEITYKGMQITVLKNNIEIKPFTRLQIFVKPTQSKTPLQNVKAITDAGKHADGPPSKRTKKVKQ